MTANCKAVRALGELFGRETFESRKLPSREAVKAFRGAVKASRNVKDLASRMLFEYSFEYSFELL